MKVKNWLKAVLRKMAGLLSEMSCMNENTAKNVLCSFSPDPETTCIAHNILSTQYDLQIIVPAYNVEKYIAQCLESALSQKTDYSYLVTVVNDGSTDRTLDIIRAYGERYPDRIEVIDQQNQGLSGARNAAMKILKGKYITFLDSDDVLVDGAVEALLRATEDGTEIVQGNWYTGVELGGDTVCVKRVQTLSGYPWGKVFKAEILEHFQFPKGYWFEDTPISFILYGKEYNFKIISDIVYGYRLNPNGITVKSRTSKRSIESYYITALCLREFPAFGVPYDQRAYEYLLQQCVMNWKRTAKQPPNIREAIFVLEAELLERYFKDMCSNDNKEIEKALREKQFRKFEVLAWTR